MKKSINEKFFLKRAKEILRAYGDSLKMDDYAILLFNISIDSPSLSKCRKLITEAKKSLKRKSK